MKLNNRVYSKNWLSHETLMKGAVVDFEMSASPNKQRGTQKVDFPYSFSDGKQ
jgi:putative alpha-1,2-mannosidase